MTNVILESGDFDLMLTVGKKSVQWLVFVNVKPKVVLLLSMQECAHIHMNTVYQGDPQACERILFESNI